MKSLRCFARPGALRRGRQPGQSALGETRLEHPLQRLGVAGVAGYEAVASGHLPAGSRRGPCLTTDRLLGDSAWARMVRELMLEVIRTARALGMDIGDKVADQNIARTRTMGAYKASTLLDFERGRPLELDSLFQAPLRQARQAGVPTPRLENLCRILDSLNTTQALRGSSPCDCRA